MLRLFAVAMLLTGFALLIRTLWLRSDAERRTSFFVALLAIVLVLAGLTMILAGG